jgi:hypothetical protein
MGCMAIWCIARVLLLEKLLAIKYGRAIFAVLKNKTGTGFILRKKLKLFK